MENDRRLRIRVLLKALFRSCFFGTWGRVLGCSQEFAPIRPCEMRRAQHPRLCQQHLRGDHAPRGQRHWLALWGFALWALLAAAYWTFHWEVLEPRSTWLVVKEGVLWPYTLDEDATWALFSHFIGFAIFVFLADGRKRWILVTDLVAISFYWLLLLLQVPTRLWAAWTNVLGFAVMLISSIVGLGLFSALAQVLTLLRTLVGAHPELEQELEGQLEHYPLLMIAVSRRDGGQPEPARIASCPARAGSGAGNESDGEKCFLCGTPAKHGASVAVCAAWREDGAAGKMLPCLPYVQMRDKLRAVEERKRELELAEKQCKKRIHELQEQHAHRQARVDEEIRWLTGLLRKHAPAAKLQRFAFRTEPTLEHAPLADATVPVCVAAEHASPEYQDNAGRGNPAPSHVQLQRQVDLLADLLVQARGGEGNTGGKREVKQLVERLAASYEQVASLLDENARLREAMSQQAMLAVHARAPSAAATLDTGHSAYSREAAVAGGDLPAAVPGEGWAHEAVGAQEVPACGDARCVSAREGSNVSATNGRGVGGAGGQEAGANGCWLSLWRPHNASAAQWAGHEYFFGGSLFTPPGWAEKSWALEGGGGRMQHAEDSEAWSGLPDALQPGLPCVSPSDQAHLQVGGEGDEGLARIERWCDALVHCD